MALQQERCSCSYSDVAIYRLDKLVNNEKINNVSELLLYGRYGDDCFLIWNSCEERLDSFHQFLNYLDEDLKFTMQIAKCYICALDLKISIDDYKIVTTV